MDAPPSGHRLSRLTREQLTLDQQEYFDALAKKTVASGGKILNGVAADGGLDGPSNARLRDPAVGSVDQRHGEVIRAQSVLSLRCLELAILSVAYAANCDYEIGAHEPIANGEGIAAAQLEQLRRGEIPDGLDPVEEATVQIARELVDTGKLSELSRATVGAKVGARALYDLVICVGYYAHLAMQLRVYRVGFPTRAGKPMRHPAPDEPAPSTLRGVSRRATR